MAIESQGVQLRRASSVEIDTDVTALSFDAAATAIYSDDTGVADFVTLGYTSGMVITSNSTLNTQCYVISAVAASELSLYQPVTAQNVTSLTIKAQTMNPVAAIASFTGPSGSANVIDITSIQSTAKEKIIGIRDEGQVSMEVFLNTDATAQHTNMKDDRKARTKRAYDILLTDKAIVAGSAYPTIIRYDCYLSGFSISIGVDEVVKASITQEISTAVLWVDAV